MYSVSRKGQYKKALLILENGEIFEGISIGVHGYTKGELIFNTSMFGYQETLTDPSYAGQIITFTFPHIGNVGVTTLDNESSRVWAAGVIVKNLSEYYSNWRANYSLPEFLVENNVVGISGVDTRALVRRIRGHRTVTAAIVAKDAYEEYMTLHNQTNVILSNSNTNARQYNEFNKIIVNDIKHAKNLVAVYNFGVKQNIIEQLHANKCSTIIVPDDMPLKELIKYNPDGVLLSNGPGDPRMYPSAINAVKQLLEIDMPIFGICLGHQILALACNARIEKMLNGGHHGSNHPIIELETQCVSISTQNHSYAIDEADFPECLKVTHRSLFDRSIQGIEHLIHPAFSLQGHPEANPGPHDMRNMFDKFVMMMRYRENYHLHKNRIE